MSLWEEEGEKDEEGEEEEEEDDEEEGEEKCDNIIFIWIIRVSQE